MADNTQIYWVSGLRPSSIVHRPEFKLTENSTFRKLGLVPSSGDGEGRHLFS
jgi:hypothetical protein